MKNYHGVKTITYPTESCNYNRNYKPGKLTLSSIDIKEVSTPNETNPFALELLGMVKTIKLPVHIVWDYRPSYKNKAFLKMLVTKLSETADKTCLPFKVFSVY